MIDNIGTRTINGKAILFIDTGKPDRNQILKQLLDDEPLPSDEYCFLRYLIKEMEDGELCMI